jgi:kynureninase
MDSTERAFAEKLDSEDPLGDYRREFNIPVDDDGEKLTYLCGHSLGAQPKGSRREVEEQLDRWAKLGVQGHFKGEPAWYTYQEDFLEPTANLVGADPDEVVYMNTLTTNLHLLMVTFYQPTEYRKKILMEASAFPSDQQVAASQARCHGLDPAETVIEVKPSGGSPCPTTGDMLEAIEKHGSETRMVFISPVNYFTGHVLDVEAIAAKAKEYGCTVGLDLAHAVGNIELDLHEWSVDFAAWCSYKYLNGGPGAIAGCFVHSRHADLTDEPRFEGWWGDDPDTRFDKKKPFNPQRGAKGWQLSNPPILSLAPLRKSLDLFDDAGISNLRDKSVQLMDYLLELLDTIPEGHFRVVTPRDKQRRGSHLSLEIYGSAAKLDEYLTDHGVICDLREPDVIRLAAAPLYNRFLDIWTAWRHLEAYFEG